MRYFSELHRKRIGEARKRGASFKCEVCAAGFWRKPYEIAHGNNKFCCRACYFVGQKGKKKDLSARPLLKGSKNPNWKGGVTPEHTAIRNGKAFKVWRESVFQRDDWTCQKCGKRSCAGSYLRIEAHHLKPFATFPSLRFEITNGQTLCKNCHSQEPKGKDIYKIK